MLTDGPIAVFEIKSPDDTFDSIFSKCSDYDSIGVENIFVLDPDQERAFRFSKSSFIGVMEMRIESKRDGWNAVVVPLDPICAELRGEV